MGAVSGSSAFSNGTFTNAIKQGINGFKNFMLQEDGYIDISRAVGKGSSAGAPEVESAATRSTKTLNKWLEDSPDEI